MDEINYQNKMTLVSSYVNILNNFNVLDEIENDDISYLINFNYYIYSFDDFHGLYDKKLLRFFKLMDKLC